jgi:tetratricopeptide (TPR) repeat protein
VIQQWESEPNHDSKDIREVLGFNLLWKGETLARMDKIRAALASYREGIASFEAAANKSAPHAVELAAGHTKTGAALAAMGKRQDAAAAYQKALAIVEPLAAAQPPDFAALYAAADAYFGMGGLSKIQARHSAAARQRNLWMEARNWCRKSAEGWRRIPSLAAIGASGFACGDPKDVARMISLCDAACGNRRVSRHKNCQAVAA